jgi:hypothetical protein
MILSSELADSFFFFVFHLLEGKCNSFDALTLLGKAKANRSLIYAVTACRGAVWTCVGMDVM